MIYIAALFCGLLFGCGLTISNMINAYKVLNFLDFTGNWDPSLAFVMISAVIVAWAGYKLASRFTKPAFAEKFFISEKKSMDVRLILGAALFGIGWGLAGYCPGPAITAIGLGIADAAYFLVGMIASLFIYPAISFLYKKYLAK
ncbi:MAG: YeeE/YedE family protein [Gammaproteobacteria bacterium]|nr:YeeE/YedE family protein [Gammaproteobacteria bacterium]